MFLCFFILFHFITACHPTNDTCFTFCVPPPSIAPPPPTPSPVTITVTKIKEKTELETKTKTITDEITLTVTTSDLLIPEETGDIPPFVFFPAVPSNEETISVEEVNTTTLDDTTPTLDEPTSSSTLVECETNLPEVE